MPIKVHIFHTGKVIVDQAIPYKENNPLAVTGLFRSQNRKLTLPVSCYLIEHPEGSVLITSISAVSDALKGKAGTFITA